MRKSEARRLEGLESTYFDILVEALRACAAGHDGSGLFGHNDRSLENYSSRLAKRLRPAAVDELLELGEEISALRQRLGYPEAFPLHARYMTLRSSYGANMPGQPKLAREWLDEIETEDDEETSKRL